MDTNTKRRHRVAILTYDGLSALEFGIAVEIFALPRPELNVAWYETRIFSFDKGPIRAKGDFSVRVQYGPRSLDWADTILIPGWSDVERPVSTRITSALRRAKGRGVRLVSICSGVFVLAASGILDGLRATTHWRYVDCLKERFPQIRLEPDALYVDEGDVLTSAGSAAGLDLCLYIVSRDFGSSIANAVAKRLILPTHRDGGQTQYVPAPVSATNRTLGRLLDSIRTNLDAPHTVSSMANQAGYSERTFIRRFNEATGQAPHAWLTGERIRQAQVLLETTNLRSDQIAERCGFATAETLRHHFRRIVGVPPIRYRASFHAK